MYRLGDIEGRFYLNLGRASDNPTSVIDGKGDEVDPNKFQFILNGNECYSKFFLKALFWKSLHK